MTLWRRFHTLLMPLAQLMLLISGASVTIDAATGSPNYLPIGCQSYTEQGGELERCQGLYTTERSWDEAAATCQSDGWTGLAVADTDDVERVVGDFVLRSDDKGDGAWTAGRELEDPVWKWSDGTDFNRERMEAALVRVNLDDDDRENCVVLRVKRRKMQLRTRDCRRTYKFFVCQLNERSAVDNDTIGECQLNGTAGVRVGQSCYVAFSGSVTQSSSTGEASWFKAQSYCYSLGARLATLDPVVADSNSIKAFVDYLTGVSPTGSFWIGLTKNPWVWVEHYDQDPKSWQTTPINLNDWLEPNQPSSRRGKDCVSIGGEGGRRGWSNQRCERRLPFVCENRTLTAVTRTTEAPQSTTGTSTGGTTTVVVTSDSPMFTTSCTRTSTGGTTGVVTSDSPMFTTSCTDDEDHLIILLVIVSVVVVVASITLAVGIFLCLRYQRRSGYTAQP